MHAAWTFMSQEDTRVCMHINFSISRFGRNGVDVTAKCTKEIEIVLTTSAKFKC